MFHYSPCERGISCVNSYLTPRAYEPQTMQDAINLIDDAFYFYSVGGPSGHKAYNHFNHFHYCHDQWVNDVV